MASSNPYSKGTKASVKALEMRKLYARKLLNKDINFSELVSIAQLPENKYLLSIKVAPLLGKMSGWHKNSALYAMTAYNIPPDIQIKDCVRSEYYTSMCNSLFSTRSDAWQRRLKAPDNWPWGEDIVSYIIAQYQGMDLPRSLEEINNNVRFHVTDDMLANISDSPTINDILDEEELENTGKKSNQNTHHDENQDELASFFDEDDEEHEEQNRGYTHNEQSYGKPNGEEHSETGNDLETLLGEDDDLDDILEDDDEDILRLLE